MCLVRTVQFQRTNVSAYAPPVFRLFYALLLIRIAAGQYTELLVVYPAKDIVLIQPLEQRIKLRCSFRQFFIFTLLGVKLPSVFRGAFFVDKFRKLSFSSRNRHRSADRNTCSFHLCLSVGRLLDFSLARRTGHFLRLFRQRKDLLFISFCMAAIISALTPFKQSLLLFCESVSELCFKLHNGYKRSAFVCAFLLYSALFFERMSVLMQS